MSSLSLLTHADLQQAAKFSLETEKHCFMKSQDRVSNLVTCLPH